MVPTKKHPYKDWEVSLIAFSDEEGEKFKVTRRISRLLVAETKVFSTKEEAQMQFEEWLE